MTAFAVMQDDTVLCADCLHEICEDRQPATAGTIVHAWLVDPAGQSCSYCGATDDRDEGLS
ncbi:MAG: hypothetical protein ACR2H2_20170 [Solirubrobacteraceae bacterium]